MADDAMSGVLKSGGGSGVDMSSPLLPEVVLHIDANRVSLYEG